jgi:UDP-N-acetylglucosamine--N-acetylmuramyl-(pentapeptide) pyrophosphoryl-undecaprenol N-acetylglucosamine transferase
VGVHFPLTGSYFPKNNLEIPLPLRKGYHLGALSKEEALSCYGLQNNCRTILIFGGSQGAQMINQQILKSIPFLRKEKIQVIHFTGTEEFVEPLKSLYALYEIPSIVKAFEKEMWKAWCAADLFIGRSGASTIAESTAFEVPGILIPYPFAAEKHQEVNARFFVDSMKGGEMLLEEELNPSLLVDTIWRCLDANTLDTYRRSLHTYHYRQNQHSLRGFIGSLFTQDEMNHAK